MASSAYTQPRNIEQLLNNLQSALITPFMISVWICLWMSATCDVLSNEDYHRAQTWCHFQKSTMLRSTFWNWVLARFVDACYSERHWRIFRCRGVKLTNEQAAVTCTFATAPMFHNRLLDRHCVTYISLSPWNGQHRHILNFHCLIICSAYKWHK